jgi:hypothetical protein
MNQNEANMTDETKGQRWHDTAPDHPLVKWMVANDRRLIWLAKRAKIDRTALATYIGGPPLSARLAIEEATGGAVKATDWPGVGE